MLYCCIVVLLPTLKKASKTSQGKGGFFNASALAIGGLHDVKREAAGFHLSCVQLGLLIKEANDFLFK